MHGPAQSSVDFVSAVERIVAQRQRGPIVVKLGGSAMEDPLATQGCLRCVALLNQLRVPLVLVHGGGNPIDRAMAEAGLQPTKVAGRRYTDDATLAIVVRVLQMLSAELVQQLNERGSQAVCSSDTLQGERLLLPGLDLQPIDLGHVGTVTSVDSTAIRSFVNAGQVPVIPSLARDPSGSWLNINADTAAAAIAGALQAERAIFLTDTPGVLRNRADPSSLFTRLTQTEGQALIEQGVIEGGMVPKVEACFEALEAGAMSAVILDGRQPYSLIELFLRETVGGTTFLRC